MLRPTCKRWLPPVLVDQLRRLRDWWQPPAQVSEAWFRAWWFQVVLQLSVPPELAGMINHFLSMASARMMSNYWWYLCKKNLEQLAVHGYDTFKQTVARHYFTWIGDDGAVLDSDLCRLARPMPVDVLQLLTVHPCLSAQESWRYNTQTALLYSTFDDPSDILEEPLEGAAPTVRIDQRAISMDTLFSALDYRTIGRCCDLSNVRTVLEIGAGYGRTAYYLLKKHPQLSYIIVDVPPALYLAKRYLTGLFPDRDLTFLLPDDICMVPDQSVDLVLAIDNFREMGPGQVQRYFTEVDRLARYFYFTYWPEMAVPFSNPALLYPFHPDGIHYTDPWPTRKRWTKIYEQRAVIPSCYVNTCYQVKA